MRLGFTGTQKEMTIEQFEIILWLLKYYNPISVHHGDCIGADYEFHKLCRLKSAHTMIVLHPPINPKKRAFCNGDLIVNPKPYLERNKDIVNRCDLLIAVPGEKKEQLRSGTWSTIRYARKVGKPHIVILP